MNKTYKFRLYPTEAQKKLITKTFGCVRFIYNRMLADKINYYQENGQTLHTTPAQYKKQYPWLKDVDSLALANAQLQLDQAYKNFFQNPRSHFPKFRSKKQGKDSYSTNNQKGSVRIDGQYIRLPKIGLVKCKQHRELSPNSTIKSVIITRNAAAKYYVTVLVNYENQVAAKQPHNIVALAFSQKGLYTDSNGFFEGYPVKLKQKNKRFLVLQKQLERCQKDSKNYRKSLCRLLIYKDKMHNQHKDLLHKLTCRLANTYDCVFLEHLTGSKTYQAKAYLHTANLNMWKMLEKYLFYKLKERGKQGILIAKDQFPRQLCCHCQARNTSLRNLTIHAWTCPQCGYQHNSDYNTALNLLQAGKKLLSA